MRELTCLSVFLLLSFLLSIAMVIAGFICQYKKNSYIKNETYECGIETFSNNNFKFNIRFFNYAIMFLIFDIETVLLYPMAVVLGDLKIFVVVESFIFVFVLLFGLFYVIKKNFLRWG